MGSRRWRTFLRKHKLKREDLDRRRAALFFLTESSDEWDGSWSLCIGAEVAVQTAAGAGPATRAVHRAASIILITSRVIGNRISRGKTRATIGSSIRCYWSSQGISIMLSWLTSRD
ncbi:hypothetical protein Q3G72_002697 [Acer saccharum]|nr:hypothetical protein Q3G72_002697 [Acer saccharum]